MPRYNIRIEERNTKLPEWTMTLVTLLFVSQAGIYHSIEAIGSYEGLYNSSSEVKISWELYTEEPPNNKGKKICPGCS